MTFLRYLNTTTGVDRGERVVDTEVVPFMRSRKISFKAEGLRPNTNVFAYFGNRNVSQWCKPTNSFVEYSTTDSEVGSEFASATQHPQGTGQLTTNEKGEVFGEFFLPNTDQFRFRTGTQDFVILDADIDTTTVRLSSRQQSDAMSSSSAPYTSTGTIESIQRTVRTTRVPQRIRGRRDPLAQSFYVDPSENPNGIFLTKVRVYVQSKDDVITRCYSYVGRLDKLDRAGYNSSCWYTILYRTNLYLHRNDIVLALYVDSYLS